MRIVGMRRIIGIVTGFAGIIISLGHLVLALVSSTPERTHGHEVVVAIGFALAVVGILLLGTDRRR